MKRISFVVLICFLLFQSHNALAGNTCVPDKLPVIYGTENKTIEVGDAKPDYLSGVYAVDSCENSVNIIVNDSEVKRDTVGTYTVYYYAQNTTVSILVNVVDTTKPVIHNAVDFTFNLSEQLTTYDYTTNLQINDNYDGVIENSKVIVFDYVNYSLPGSYTVSYYVSDRNGNSTTEIIKVTITDTEKPKISGIKNLEVYLGDVKESDFYLEGVTVTDNSGLETKIKIDDSLINYQKVGKYPLSYIVFDSSGNYEQAQITVEIVADDVPVIEGVKDITIEAKTENYDFLQGITAFDIYDNNLTDSLEVDLTQLDLTTLGSYAITYSVVDIEGRKGTKTCIINVVDTTKPEITGYKDITIKLNETVDLLNGITATDKYDGDLTAEIKATGYYNVSEEGEYTITLEVSDSSNNTHIVSFKLIVSNSERNQQDKSPKKSEDYSMYYIIGIISVSLVASGVLGYRTRNRRA